ncbi:hypothetical protein BC834DRAFT_974781 [Gloeopeniophorella convolvens]|nr:hypothetical protein BC834DRAFT_974781 [Gloeopeniophorella convolvens]
MAGASCPSSHLQAGMASSDVARQHHARRRPARLTATAPVSIRSNMWSHRGSYEREKFLLASQLVPSLLTSTRSPRFTSAAPTSLFHSSRVLFRMDTGDADDVIYYHSAISLRANHNLRTVEIEAIQSFSVDYQPTRMQTPEGLQIVTLAPAEFVELYVSVGKLEDRAGGRMEGAHDAVRSSFSAPAVSSTGPSAPALFEIAPSTPLEDYGTDRMGWEQDANDVEFVVAGESVEIGAIRTSTTTELRRAIFLYRLDSF